MKSEIIVLNGAKHFNIKSTCEFESSKFKNDETCFRLKCSVRYKPVIIIQSFRNTNDDIWELYLAIDAIKRAGALSVTALLPIFPYARQDRKHKSGVPISAKIFCNTLASIGLNRLICYDLHSDQIQGMMDKDVIFDHIDMTSFMSYNIKKIINNIYNYTFVAPDAGAVKRAVKYADNCNATDLVIMDKTRTQANVVDSIRLIGNVNNKNLIITDDMIDTGSTLSKATDELSSKGCGDIYLICTHGIFSDPCTNNLSGMNIICTNSLNCDKIQTKQFNEFIVFDISPFIKSTINCIDKGLPFGPLFNKWGYNNKH
jgi:ribose-phosphate pyrophosphokinase